MAIEAGDRLPFAGQFGGAGHLVRVDEGFGGNRHDDEVAVDAAELACVVRDAGEGRGGAARPGHRGKFRGREEPAVPSLHGATRLCERCAFREEGRFGGTASGRILVRGSRILFATEEAAEESRFPFRRGGFGGGRGCFLRPGRAAGRKGGRQREQDETGCSQGGQLHGRRREGGHLAAGLSFS